MVFKIGGQPGLEEGKDRSDQCCADDGGEAGDDGGFGEKAEHELDAAAAEYSVDTGLFCAPQGLGGGQVDEIDDGEEQDENGDAHEGV